MNKKIIVGAIVAIVVAGGSLTFLKAGSLKGLWRSSLPIVMQVQPAPTVGPPTATPNLILVSTPTQVTVTVQILDSRLVAGGVNLIRLGATGTQASILGVMRDDGLSGDIVAGDKVFTQRVNINETVGGQIQLQVSAAFKGLLRRVTSLTVSVEVRRAFSSQALGIAFNYPADYSGAVGTPSVGETISLTAFSSSLPAGGLDVPLGCVLDFSVKDNGSLQPLNQWMQHNIRTDGVDTAITRDLVVGVRKVFLDDVSQENSVMFVFPKGNHMYTFSAVGEECIQDLDSTVETVEFF